MSVGFQEASASDPNAEPNAAQPQETQMPGYKLSPAAKAAHETASKVNDKMGNTLASLYVRWQDEGKYEDFSQYEAVMKKRFSTIKAGTFIAGSKRPFGFRWKGKDGHTRLTSINSRGWIQTARLD